MASKTIDTLPTDIVAIVASFLTVKDIKQLRQVNRWAEKETFNPFAERGYKCVDITTDVPTLRRVVKVINRSPNLARSVRTIKLKFYKATYRRCEKTTCSHSQHPEDVIAKLGNDSAAQLLKLLLGVTEMQLDSVSPDAFAQQFPVENVKTLSAVRLDATQIPSGQLKLRYASAWPALACLRMKDSSLVTTQLIILIQALSSELGELYLDNVAFKEGATSTVLAALAPMLPALTRLSLRGLAHTVAQPDSGAHRHSWFFDNVPRFIRAFKTADGIEVADVVSGDAEMRGRRAVEVGMAHILKSIGS